MDRSRDCMYDSGVEHNDSLFYITLPPALRTLRAHCTTVGTSRTPRGAPYPPHPRAHPHAYRSLSDRGRILDEWQLVFVSEGSGRHTAPGGVRTDVHANGLIVVRPGVWHRYAPDPTVGWTEHWVGFTGSIFDQAVEAVGLPDAPIPVPDRYRETLLAQFDELRDLAADLDTSRHIVMIASVLRLLGLVGSWSGSDAPLGYSDEVEASIARMAAAPDGSISVVGLAERAGLSESALRRRFVRETRMSPYQYYSMLRVNRIKVALAHSHDTLASIATQFGFTDAFHLSRVFKQYTGLSPSDWRTRGG